MKNNLLTKMTEFEGQKVEIIIEDNLMVNENELLEKKDLREEMIGKVEVLDKVKKLILLPDTEYATKKQVAKYYEVKVDAIESIERRIAF